MFSALVGAFFTSESLGKPQQRYIQSIKELSRAQENVHSLQCFMVIEFSCFSRCCVIWTTCLAQLKDTSLDLAFQNEEAKAQRVKCPAQDCAGSGSEASEPSPLGEDWV